MTTVQRASRQKQYMKDKGILDALKAINTRIVYPVHENEILWYDGKNIIELTVYPFIPALTVYNLSNRFIVHGLSKDLGITVSAYRRLGQTLSIIHGASISGEYPYQYGLEFHLPDMRGIMPCSEIIPFTC